MEIITEIMLVSRDMSVNVKGSGN